jgi:hypothetical protein
MYEPDQDPDRLLRLIVIMFFILALICILGGLAAAFGTPAQTVMTFFSIRLSTTNVGVAFAAIGIIVAYLAAKIVLDNRLATWLATIQAHQPLKRPRSCKRDVGPQIGRENLPAIKEKRDRSSHQGTMATLLEHLRRRPT